MAIVDMVGKRFGKLVVLSESGRFGTAMHVTWLCQCDCGNQTIVVGASMRAGRSSTCGCGSAQQRFTSDYAKTHGESRTRTYRIWAGMIRRCNDFNSPKAHLYARKGIRVAERWSKYENFRADMGLAPPGLTLDRIDSNKNYEPGNCRWASRIVQGNNTNANVRISHNGKDQTVSEWARELKIKSNTLTYRLRRGWPIERALAF
mgnify:CR=1 FL=1